jgi:hypothetical protein
MDPLLLRKLTSCLGYSRRLATKQDLQVIAQHVDRALLYLRCAMLSAPTCSSEHFPKRIIYLSDLLARDVTAHWTPSSCGGPKASVQVSQDVATQTDDEQFPMPHPDFLSETISRTVKEQVEPLTNLLKQTQEASEAMAARCRILEERHSFVHEPVGQHVESSATACATAKGSQGEFSNDGREPLDDFENTRRATSSKNRAVNASDFHTIQASRAKRDSTSNADHVVAKQQRREARRRELEAKVFGR